MSMFLTVPTACGAMTTDIDVFDLELNPHGGVCCDNCKSIISARESWAALYNYSFI